jgi:hypothetical protein
MHEVGVVELEQVAQALFTVEQRVHLPELMKLMLVQESA